MLGRKIRGTRYLLMGSVAVSSLTVPALQAPAHAQTLTPVVDVCTGITLERSALSDLLEEINTGVVSGIDSSLDTLLGVVFGGGLTVDVAGIIAGAESGDNISVQVLNSDGELVGPTSGDCNIQADGYSLSDPAGIAIGGNAITGLGAENQAASAAELDAIAFGNNASTSAGATGAIAIGPSATVTAADSIALGNGASASVANSLALGANSTATRGAQAGYSAPGLTGTSSSVGEVSVGSPGNERQLTNVAAGTAATDAATVGQLQGALDAVDDLADAAVQYDDGTQTSVTLGGAGGTTITNLADGTLSDTSSDAVNGSQLFATNELVADNADDISTNATNISTNTSNIATNTSNIATNTADIATNAGDIAALDAAAVQYDDASQETVTLAGAGGTTVTNVANGALNASSSDAVNGAQLHATNQQVLANATAIAAIDPTAGNAVIYDDATLASVTLGGEDGTTVSNLAAGELSASSTEAVNGSQLFATNQAVGANGDAITRNTTDIANLDGRVTTNETDIANLDGRVTTNEDDIVALDDRVTVNEGDIASLDGRVTTNEGDIASLDNRVTVNEGDIVRLDTAYVDIDDRVTVNEGAITTIQTQLANAPVTYVDDANPAVASATPTDTVGLVGASGGQVRFTNVAAGEVSASSTDAVNGAQLAATNTQVARNRTDIDRNRTDIDQNTADIVTINNSLAGSTVVAVQYSNPDTPTQSNGGTRTNDVTLVGRNSAAPVALHNVADARLPTDAVNLRQMQSGLEAAVETSRDYTDARIAEVGFDLKDMRRDSFAGIAGALAVAGIPQPVEVGSSMVGGAVGHYRGETAFAIGASTSLDDGKSIIKVGASIDTRGYGSFSGGAGFSF